VVAAAACSVSKVVWAAFPRVDRDHHRRRSWQL